MVWLQLNGMVHNRSASIYYRSIWCSAHIFQAESISLLIFSGAILDFNVTEVNKVIFLKNIGQSTSNSKYTSPVVGDKVLLIFFIGGGHLGLSRALRSKRSWVISSHAVSRHFLLNIEVYQHQPYYVSPTQCVTYVSWFLWLELPMFIPYFTLLISFEMWSEHGKLQHMDIFLCTRQSLMLLHAVWLRMMH